MAPSRTIMSNQVQRIIIPGEPIPKGRPRMAVTKRGTRITYTPERTKQFAERVEKWALTQKVKKMDGLLRVVIWFWIKKPKSWKVYDIDNLAKGILDPLNGLAWGDDRQIVDLLCFKRTGIDDPLTDITITSWVEDEKEKDYLPELPVYMKGGSLDV